MAGTRVQSRLERLAGQPTGSGRRLLLFATADLRTKYLPVAQALRLIGWAKTSIEAGDVVTIRMYVAKNGNPAGRLQKIVLADGSELRDTQLGGDAPKTRYDPEAGK